MDPSDEKTTLLEYSVQEQPRGLRGSMVLGLLSTALLLIGLYAPAIDFSAYHEKVQLHYSLAKVCKNVGLISSLWTGLPYGLLIAAVMMLALSFVREPIFKLIPCILILALLVVMLVDMGNVVIWIEDVINRFANPSEPIHLRDIITASQVLKSFMIGVYSLAAGLVVGLVSAFVKR